MQACIHAISRSVSASSPQIKDRKLKVSHYSDFIHISQQESNGHRHVSLLKGHACDGLLVQSKDVENLFNINLISTKHTAH